MLNNKCSWTFYDIWNKSLEENNHQRPLQPRDKIWASEFGNSYIDRYLKMKGEPPTNPPNARSRRKFEAGNIWEAIVNYVLRRAGILQDYQKWLSYQYPDLLVVSGKLDFIAGGTPDYDKAISVIQTELNWLPEFVTRATKNIVEVLKEKYPNGLKDIILEIKSCSSFMFELYEKGIASPHHKLQTFHYLKATEMPEGHIVYISKDDARMIEIGIFNPSAVEKEYKENIKTMTYYYKTDTLPPLEQPIVYDEDFKKFSVNFKVGYSQYLTKLYGFKNQKEFNEKYKPIVERWNRVLKRIQNKDKITENNLQALKEMKKAGFDPEFIVFNQEDKKWK
jgi:hypothetical protein